MEAEAGEDDTLADDANLLPPSWDVPARKPVIWINGWPAVGKASVAGFLKLLIGAAEVVLVNEDGEDDASSAHPIVALDVHAGCDDAAAEDAAAARRRARAFGLHILAEASLEKTTIFTACQPDTDKGAAIAAEYADAAREAGRLFVPVCLVCDERENLRRLVAQAGHAVFPGRAQSREQALAVRALGLYDFSRDGNGGDSSKGPPPSLPSPPSSLDDYVNGPPAANAFHIDATSLTPIEAGVAILRHLQQAEARRLRREVRAGLAARAECERLRAECGLEPRGPTAADAEAARRLAAAVAEAAVEAFLRGKGRYSCVYRTPRRVVLKAPLRVLCRRRSNSV